jgi:hypothetical protein
MNETMYDMHRSIVQRRRRIAAEVIAWTLIAVGIVAWFWIGGVR